MSATRMISARAGAAASRSRTIAAPIRHAPIRRRGPNGIALSRRLKSGNLTMFTEWMDIDQFSSGCFDAINFGRYPSAGLSPRRAG